MKPTPIPYEERAFTIAAGATVRWPGMAKWVRILEATNDTIECSFYPGTQYSVLRKGITVKLVDQTEGFQLKNTGGASTTITIARGFLPIDDNRLTVITGTVLSVSISGVPHVIVDTLPAIAFAAPQHVIVDSVPTPTATALGTVNFDSAATGDIVSAAANLNGIDVITAGIFATDGGLSYLFAGTKTILGIGSIVGASNNVTLQYPIRIPAGVAFKFQNGGSSHCYGTYNLL